MHSSLRRSILFLGLSYASVALAGASRPAARGTDAWLDADARPLDRRRAEDLGDARGRSDGDEVVEGPRRGAREGRVQSRVGSRAGSRRRSSRPRAPASPSSGSLAEYDALPGLSQAAGRRRRRRRSSRTGPGHGCGHNLLGTAAMAAAIAANRERIEKKLPGTIQLFGTPAEEQLYGKLFMIRDGAFRDTDVVLSWHPDDENRVNNRTRLALVATDVEFFGKSAHAAANPWLGRSALDALVLFDHAISLMREHIRPTARIHRIVTDGGAAANIIPDYAKGQFWLRDASWRQRAGDARPDAQGRGRRRARDRDARAGDGPRRRRATPCRTTRSTASSRRSSSASARRPSTRRTSRSRRRSRRSSDSRRPASRPR